LTCYQCKKAKSVIILTTLHPDVEVSSENNTKKKPETVLFHNKTKAGVDVVDQMSRKYSVKAASRRWPVHVFYNVIHLAIINSWVLYKETCRSRISRREHMQRVAEELCGTSPNNQMMNWLKGSRNLPQKSEGRAQLRNAAIERH